MTSNRMGSPVRLLVVTVLTAMAFVTLPACRADGQDRTGRADGGRDAAPAAAATEPAFPPGLTRFDMVCETRGRLLGTLYPDSLRAWPDPGSEPSVHRFRLSVDLEAMESCGPWCATMPSDWIESADADRIFFDRGNGAYRDLRRSDGFYRHRLFDGKNEETETGRCTRAPFTAFPDRELPGFRARPAPGLATLRARLARYERDVDRSFIDLFESEAVTRVVREARSEWDRRYRNCRDDACRRTILADRVARLEYAFGRRTAPFPGLAFPGGSIGLRTVDPYVRVVYAGATIFPIIDDRILMSVDAVNTPPLMAFCSVAAEGRATANGAIQMTALGDPGEPVLRWDMRLEPGDRLTIAPLGSFSNPYCGATVGIAYTFDIDGSNGGGGS